MDTEASATDAVQVEVENVPLYSPEVLCPSSTRTRTSTISPGELNISRCAAVIGVLLLVVGVVGAGLFPFQEVSKSNNLETDGRRVEYAELIESPLERVEELMKEHADWPIDVEYEARGFDPRVDVKVSSVSSFRQYESFDDLMSDLRVQLELADDEKYDLKLEASFGYKDENWEKKLIVQDSNNQNVRVLTVILSVQRGNVVRK